MRFMVVEHFRDGSASDVYERARTKGRLLRDGLHYDMSRCFQLIETDDRSLFDTWIATWDDLVTFEVFQAMSSGQAVERMSSTS